jgi:hypothetical protein
MRRRDEGSGALLVLLVASAVLALGLGLITIASTERAIAGNAYGGAEALYAADSLAEFVVTELSSDISWTPALAGERHSTFLEPATQTIAPWNEALDLSALTVAVQQQSDVIWTAGPDTPQWRLFAAGPLAALVSSGLAGSLFVMAWIADDASETDGNPAVDLNDVVMVRVQALGLGGLQRALLIVLRRGGDAPDPPGVRVVSWREVR